MPLTADSTSGMLLCKESQGVLTEFVDTAMLPELAGLLIMKSFNKCCRVTIELVVWGLLN